jgi:hypothetical protein
MNPELSRKVDWLYSGPNRKTTMTKKEVESVIDEIGTEIIVHGRLRTIQFKKIIGSRYNVSTTPFTK